MSEEVTGKVKHVGETEVFQSGFQKRLVVLTIMDGNYEKDVGFNFIKDKTEKLDGVCVGDDVLIKYNIGGCREYNGKWYSDMHTGWYLKVESQGASPAPNDVDEDDVPF